MNWKTRFLIALLFPLFVFAQQNNDVSKTKEQHVTPLVTLEQVKVANVTPAIAGNRTLYYWIVSIDKNGNKSFPAGAFIIRNSQNPISTRYFNTISWQPVSNAVAYDVLRTTAIDGATGTCNCAVATNVKNTFYKDVAEALNTYTVTDNSADFISTNEVDNGEQALLTKYKGSKVFTVKKSGVEIGTLTATEKFVVSNTSAEIQLKNPSIDTGTYLDMMTGTNFFLGTGVRFNNSLWTYKSAAGAFYAQGASGIGMGVFTGKTVGSTTAALDQSALWVDNNNKVAFIPAAITAYTADTTDAYSKTGRGTTSTIFRDWKMTGSNNECFTIQNESGGSLSRFRFINVSSTNCSNVLHITSYDPTHAQSGNVYDISLLNPDFSVNSGDGVLIDGQTGTPELNIFGGTIGGNGNSNLHFTRSNDALGASSVIHLANIFGTVLQGATKAAVSVDSSYLTGSMIGAYFEQNSGYPAFEVSNTGSVKGLLLAGNSFGAAAKPTLPTYLVKHNYNGSGSASAWVSLGNSFSGCTTAAYKIDGTFNAMIGFGDVITNCPAHIDWTSTLYNSLFANDIVNRTYSISSDGLYFDHPKVGIGLKGNAITALFQIGAQRKPAIVSGNGTTAQQAMIVTAGAGGDTSGTTGQTAGKGGNIEFNTGVGGSAPTGSTNGNGGDLVITLGAAGSGTGTVGTGGNFKIKNHSGTDIFSVSEAGKLTTIGGVSWTVGTGAPTGVCTNGSIYTATNGTTTNILWVCGSSTWQLVK